MNMSAKLINSMMLLALTLCFTNLSARACNLTEDDEESPCGHNRPRDQKKPLLVGLPRPVFAPELKKRPQKGWDSDFDDDGPAPTPYELLQMPPFKKKQPALYRARQGNLDAE
jgi:hypothetical protein